MTRCEGPQAPPKASLLLVVIIVLNVAQDVGVAAPVEVLNDGVDLSDLLLTLWDRYTAPLEHLLRGDESLDAVIDALERLREADRLVGVITHVAQLAERIPDGLRVERRGGGSVISRRDAGRASELG